MIRLFYFLRRFCTATRGLALVEFVAVLPVLLLLSFGALELARAMIITQRVEKMAYVLADITSQYPPATGERLAGEINEAELQNNVFTQFNRMMGTYADAGRQNMILTSVMQEGGSARIKWQATGGGTLNRNVRSVVNGLSPSSIGPGVKNQVATFAEDAEIASHVRNMANNENMIIAEVFYQYEPIWTRITGAIQEARSSGESVSIARSKLLTKRMYFRPRNGDLICLPDSFIYSPCIPPPVPGGPGNCPVGQCYVASTLYSGNGCGECAAPGTVVVTRAEPNCRRMQCRADGTFEDIGPGTACSFEHQCDVGE